MNILSKLIITGSILGFAQGGYADYRIWLIGAATTMDNQKKGSEVTLSNTQTATVPGVGSAVEVTTAGSFREFKDPKATHSSNGFHMVLPFGLGLGYNMTTDKKTTPYKATSNIASSLGSTATPIVGYAYSGDTLSYRHQQVDIGWLDLSYTLPIPYVIINVGGGMPVTGKSTIKMNHTDELVAILDALSPEGAASEETLQAKGLVANAMFINLGFSLGRFDFLVGYRSDYYKSYCDLSNSPLRQVFGTTKLYAETRSNSVNVGLGLHF